MLRLATICRLLAGLAILAAGDKAHSAVAPAAQTCNLSGHWRIVHSSDAWAEMDVSHVGNRLTGAGREGRNTGTMTGGRVRGREVYLRIKWSNGHIGEYTGRVNMRGKLSGLNHDVVYPGSQNQWHVSERLDCIQD